MNGYKTLIQLDLGRGLLLVKIIFLSSKHSSWAHFIISCSVNLDLFICEFYDVVFSCNQCTSIVSFVYLLVLILFFCLTNLNTHAQVHINFSQEENLFTSMKQDLFWKLFQTKCIVNFFPCKPYSLTNVASRVYRDFICSLYILPSNKKELSVILTNQCCWIRTWCLWKRFLFWKKMCPFIL